MKTERERENKTERERVLYVFFTLEGSLFVIGLLHDCLKSKVDDNCELIICHLVTSNL